MENTCVCCGEIIPEGRQVCPSCEEVKYVCPECGNKLTLMYSGNYITAEQFFIHKIYNCESCHSDWESATTYVGEPEKLGRKFWG